MIDTKAILAEVKENHRKLDACVGPHDFSIMLDRRTKQPITERQMFCHWRCTKCGGDIDNLYKIWYERGLKHAAK